MSNWLENDAEPDLHSDEAKRRAGFVRSAGGIWFRDISDYWGGF